MENLPFGASDNLEDRVVGKLYCVSSNRELCLVMNPDHKTIDDISGILDIAAPLGPKIHNNFMQRKIMRQPREYKGSLTRNDAPLTLHTTFSKHIVPPGRADQNLTEITQETVNAHEYCLDRLPETAGAGGCWEKAAHGSRKSTALLGSGSIAKSFVSDALAGIGLWFPDEKTKGLAWRTTSVSIGDVETPDICVGHVHTETRSSNKGYNRHDAVIVMADIKSTVWDTVVYWA